MAVRALVCAKGGIRSFFYRKCAEMLPTIWDLFPEVAARVRASHEAANCLSHHDWQHAFRVGQVAYTIAMIEWGDELVAKQAGLAGKSHNADRVLKSYAENKSAAYEATLSPVSLAALWIGNELQGHQEPILSAVVNHARKNQEGDSRVLIAVQDADRVVNLDPDLFPRSGQHYAKLPVVDYKYLLENPKATYRNPLSVFRDIAYSLDWVNPGMPDVCIRTRAGMEMALRRTHLFGLVVDSLRDFLEEERLYPYPFH